MSRICSVPFFKQYKQGEGHETIWQSMNNRDRINLSDWDFVALGSRASSPITGSTHVISGLSFPDALPQTPLHFPPPLELFLI